VRHLLAILLLSAVNFPLITPVVSAQSDPEIPPCCRLAGKHKCALKRASPHRTAAAVSSIRAQCPFSAATGTAALASHAFLHNASVTVSENNLVSFAAASGDHQVARPLFARAHYTRGPPNLLS